MDDEKNVLYWSSYVARRISLEKEDVFQELLVAIWEEFNRKKVNKYYIKKRLYYAVLTILRRYFKSDEKKLNKLYIDNFDFNVEINDEMFEYDYFEIVDEYSTIKNDINYIRNCIEIVKNSFEDFSRERIILDMMCDQHSYSKISKRLEISKSRVRQLKDEKIKPCFDKLLN